MTYAVKTGTGNIFAAETDTLFIPAEPRTGKAGVILLHGASTPEQYTSASWPTAAELGMRLARAGIPCIAGAMGGDTWGNDTAMSRVDAAHAYLAAQTGASSTRACLVGTSMGNSLGFRWAGLNPTKAAAVVGMIPLSSLVNSYTNDVGGLRASIGTAWGVAWPTELPASANLLTHAATMAAAGIPSRLYYSGVDTLVPPADVTALGDAADSDVVQDVDAAFYGHTWRTLGEVRDLGAGAYSGLVQFLLSNGA